MDRDELHLKMLRDLEGKRVSVGNAYEAFKLHWNITGALWADDDEPTVETLFTVSVSGPGYDEADVSFSPVEVKSIEVAGLVTPLITLE